MRTFVRSNSLSLFFFGIFLAALVGQAFAGWAQFNDLQAASGMQEIGLGRYLTSADFAVDVTENWQSEYLQFLLYIVATVFFVQQGSPESPAHGGLGSDKEQKLGRHTQDDSPTWARAGGVRTSIFSWSLTLVMGTIFLVSWLAQSIAGWAAFNETRLQDRLDPISWGSYLLNPDFWARTLQNWQSEFLAVGSMAVLAIYLRQRGSAESKPVGEPHASTGAEGA
ncbi:DUF6766 family protein [Aeromicrobium sp. NPDC092404]|uniref:DUF6766 family protein n=1 Tax=Aeromicrobium sp. NPDC092404 TaxID=3154976 RepID=UPI00341F0F8C